MFEIIQQNCTFHLRVLFCREHSEGRRKIKNWREGYFWVSLLIGRQVAMGQHHIKIFQSLFFRACQANFFFRKEKAGTTHSYRIQTSSHHHYGIILMQKFGTESTGIQRDNIQKNGWEDDTFYSIYIQKWKRDSHTLWFFFFF